MNRDVGAVILVLLGGAVARLAITDAYLQYVREGMRPWLILAGVILILLGLGLVVDALRRPAQATPEQTNPEQGHPHDHGSGVGGRVGYLLLVPVLTVFLIAPPALGAYTAERATALVVPPSDVAAPDPLPPGSPVEVYLSDFAARAVWDEGRTLAGRQVRMVGFVSAKKDSSSWYLTRLSITCCAADALTVKVLVVDPPADPPVGTWVAVTGEWIPGGGTNTETAIPWLKVERLEKTDEPKNPYE